MNYDRILTAFGYLSDFISTNQVFLTAALLIFAYFLKRYIDYQAATPEVDIWDTIKPGSDAFYRLAQKGVDYLGESKGLDAAQKLKEYLRVIEEFETNWKSDKFEAIKKLAAWYLSMEAKKKVENVAANPSIGPDDPALP